MKLEKAIRLKNDKMGEIVKLFLEAEKNGYISSKLHKDVTKISENLPEDTPNWVEFYLLGCKDALYENLYQDNKIVFYGWFADGSIYALDDTHPDYYIANGYENVKIVKTAFLWRKTKKNFTEWVSF